MKSYTLDIEIEKGIVRIHEKTSEGVNLAEARMIVAVLEEYKTRMMQYIIFNQTEAELKKQGGNEKN